MPTQITTTETLPDGTEAIRVNDNRIRFNVSRPQIWHDTHRNRDRVLRYFGHCVGCNRRTYGFDDGENDPRGMAGDHAVSIETARDHDLVGPDVVACFMCMNDEPTYHRVMRHAKKVWREKPPILKIDLSEFAVKAETFWDVSRNSGADGYDTMDDAAKQRWVAVSGWGRDGWDFLEWPYYVGYVRNTSDGFELATNCEGDVDVWRFPTLAARVAAMDDLAFWHWQIKGKPWVEGIYPDERPDHLRGSGL